MCFRVHLVSPKQPNEKKYSRAQKDLPSALSLVHHKRQEHVKQHHTRHEQRMDRLQEMSVEHQLRDRQHTVQQMHRVVAPAACGRGDGAIAEQGPEDDGDDDVEADHGAVQEPVQVAEPAASLGVDPVAAREGGLAQVADGPQRCALLGGEREEGRMIDRTELAELLLIECSDSNGREQSLRVLMGHKKQI